MRYRLSLLGVFTTLGLGFLGASAHADTNLIANGGFETGDFTGFTQINNADGDTFVANSGFNAYFSDGNYFAAFGEPGPDFAGIEQTVAVTPGDTYQLSFELASDGQSPNEFEVTASSQATPLVDETNTDTSSVFQTQTYDITPTGSSLTLQFLATDAPSYLGLDDVSLTDISPAAATGTPTPTAFGGGAILLAGVLLCRRLAKPAVAGGC